MGNQIALSGEDLFALTCKPDGVYCINGRSIPIRDDSTVCLNNSKPVVGVHNADNLGVRIGGTKIGVDLEK